MSIRARAAVTSVVTVMAWLALGPVGPASAHGGDGQLEVVARTEPGPLRVEYVVMLTYVNDGDPGTDATVTLAASSPGGATVTPVTMTGESPEGRYRGTLTFPSPGAWSVRITSVTPPAEFEIDEEITAPTTTTAVPSTTSTTEPAATPTTVAAPATSNTSSSGDDDNVMAWVLAGVGVVVIIGAIVLITRRRPEAG